MGLSIDLIATQPVSVWQRNITSNLVPMASAAGLYEVLWKPEQLGIGRAGDLIPYLEKGIEVLKSDPTRFEALNPPNGWGSYSGLLASVLSYLDACREFPEAKISIWA